MNRIIRCTATLVAVIATSSAAGCAVGGPGSVGSLGAGSASDAAFASSSPLSSPASSSAGPAAAAATKAQRVGSVVPQVPREIQLPNGHRMHVNAVSTRSNGLLDVPSDIQAAGWWRGGARIGDPFGSTLIAAHVDSFTQGLGPFSALLSAQRGDEVVVWTRGLRQIFRVTSLHLRARSAVIGARSSLHSPAGRRRLTLITCAGPYLRAEGGYQNLAVVTAVPVGDPRVRSTS